MIPPSLSKFSIMTLDAECSLCCDCFYCYAECCSAECSYAECRGAKLDLFFCFFAEKKEIKCLTLSSLTRRLTLGTNPSPLITNSGLRLSTGASTIKIFTMAIKTSTQNPFVSAGTSTLLWFLAGRSRSQPVWSSVSSIVR